MDPPPFSASPSRYPGADTHVRRVEFLRSRRLARSSRSWLPVLRRSGSGATVAAAVAERTGGVAGSEHAQSGDTLLTLAGPWLGGKRSLLQPIPGVAALERRKPKDLTDAPERFFAGSVAALAKRGHGRGAGCFKAPLESLRRRAQVSSRIRTPGGGRSLGFDQRLGAAPELTKHRLIAELVGRP